MSDPAQRSIECSKCGKAFECTPKGSCWCNNYQLSTDRLKDLKATFADCLCENCLTVYSKETK